MARSVRGSIVGLIRHHEDLKKKNTDAMWSVLLRLEMEKPQLPWSYKEVWSGAGLKSGVALSSVWNRHIREAIELHNAKLIEGESTASSDISNSTTLAERNFDLRNKVKELKVQRDHAYSKIAQYESDLEFYKKKFEDVSDANFRLLEKIKRAM